MVDVWRTLSLAEGGPSSTTTAVAIPMEGPVVVIEPHHLCRRKSVGRPHVEKISKTSLWRPEQREKTNVKDDFKMFKKIP